MILSIYAGYSWKENFLLVGEALGMEGGNGEHPQFVR